MKAGGILSKEMGAGVGLVMGGILSKEDGVGTDAGPGWVLVADGAEEGYISGTFTREEEVLVKSTGVEVSVGLERAADTAPEVIVDVGILGITGGGGEGLVVTVQTGGTVTGALNSPAAAGLKEENVCRFKLPAESNLG